MKRRLRNRNKRRNMFKVNVPLHQTRIPTPLQQYDQNHYYQRLHLQLWSCWNCHKVATRMWGYALDNDDSDELVPIGVSCDNPKCWPIVHVNKEPASA